MAAAAVGGSGRGAGQGQVVEAHHQRGHRIFNHLPSCQLPLPPCLIVIALARPAIAARVPLRRCRGAHLRAAACGGFRGRGMSGPERLGREEKGKERGPKLWFRKIFF